MIYGLARPDNVNTVAQARIDWLKGLFTGSGSCDTTDPPCKPDVLGEEWYVGSTYNFLNINQDIATLAHWMTNDVWSLPSTTTIGFLEGGIDQISNPYLYYLFAEAPSAAEAQGASVVVGYQSNGFSFPGQPACATDENAPGFNYLNMTIVQTAPCVAYPGPDVGCHWQCALNGSGCTFVSACSQGIIPTKRSYPSATPAGYDLGCGYTRAC